MNNYSEGRRFVRLLNEVDTCDVVMDAADWCRACGFLSDYGGGYRFNMPQSDAEVKRKIEEVVEAEVAAAEDGE